MELTIGGKPLLTRDMWDDIDFMWGLLVNTLEQLETEGSATLELSGLRLVFKLVRRDTLSVAVENPVRGGRTAAGVEDRNFYAHMISAGEHFFRRLEDLQGDGGFQQDLRRIEALRAQGVETTPGDGTTAAVRVAAGLAGVAVTCAVLASFAWWLVPIVLVPALVTVVLRYRLAVAGAATWVSAIGGEQHVDVWRRANVSASAGKDIRVFGLRD